MKNKSMAVFGAMLLASNMSAYAGDREWATVGKVLTGVVAIQVIDRIVNPPTQVVYVQQPAVVQTVPVVVQPQPVVYVQPAVPVVYYSSPQVIVYTGCPTPVYRYHYHHHHHR